MKINQKCIQSVMLALEEHLSLKQVNDVLFFEPMTFEQLFFIVNKDGARYSREDVAYSIIQLIHLGYIVVSNPNFSDQLRKPIDFGGILYITPSGHDFIKSF